MQFDFALLFVVLTAVSGVIWGLDRLFFARHREADAREPAVVEYARSFFPILLFVLVVRSFLVEPFRIPSGSMLPGLQVGDFVAVNKYAYGLRWPVLNKKFVDIGMPERGDVAVFRYPKDPSQNYIKRVIGVPGDVVEYINKTLYVNGEPAVLTPLGPYIGTGGGRVPREAVLLSEQMHAREHKILNYHRGGLNFGHERIVVEPGHYFVMGDNRDDSQDSRSWGQVPEDHLVGRAILVWFHWHTNNSWSPIGWGRIGTMIK